MKKCKTIIKLLNIMLVFTIIISTKVQAAQAEETDAVGRAVSSSQASETTSNDLSSLKDIYNVDSSLLNKGGQLYWIAQVICYTVAIIILIVKGVNFMRSAPEAKADIKKELVYYLIGAIILFAAGTIVGVIGGMAKNNI